ncbi:MAG: RNA polymerase sigma factor [Lachnospiraceae bacterium]|nr:RNA polymerase sigma factor [Lachnospiraceae bacterium]
MEQEKIVAFLEENIKTIYAYALSRISKKEDAEELAGDIMVAILQDGHRVQREEAFFGYVWSIAANTYKKYLRRQSRAVMAELEAADAETEDFSESVIMNLWQKEQTGKLRRELALLSKEYRECTVAYYFDELSCKEVAEKFHISLEMVKYYLFKTRKLLKEGIEMEREFGEKSYKPGTFELVTIFDKNYNEEYVNLFRRKLSGNILLSAYYTPMTIRELSIEMGVSTVYMEDEVVLLEKYGLLKALPGGKYQTNLAIITEEYTKEFYRTVKGECQRRLAQVFEAVRGKLGEIRTVGFIGNQLSENRLLWGFLYMLMHHGYQAFKEKEQTMGTIKLYGEATGICYGVNFEKTATEEYGSGYFAGFSGLDERYAAAFADFGILPVENHYTLQYENVREKLYKALEEPDKAPFMILTTAEYGKLREILQEEILCMKELYEYLTKQGTELMKVHAPAHMAEMIPLVIARTIYFRTVGLVGGCALQSGALELPKEPGPVALYVYAITEENKLDYTLDVTEKDVKY